MFVDKEKIVKLVGEMEDINIEEINDETLAELGFPNSSLTLKCRTWPFMETGDSEDKPFEK